MFLIFGICFLLIFEFKKSLKSDIFFVELLACKFYFSLISKTCLHPEDPFMNEKLTKECIATEWYCKHTLLKTENICNGTVVSVYRWMVAIKWCKKLTTNPSLTLSTQKGSLKLFLDENISSGCKNT